MKNLNLKSSELPSIKERRIQYIVKCLMCFHKHPFNREMQKACILEVYGTKNDQSVFRGVTIQTLRKLELIIGRNDKLRLTLNAEIIVATEDELIKQRSIGAVFFEIDNEKYKVIQAIKKGATRTSDLLLHFGLNSNLSSKQLKERINSWLEILRDIDLIREGKDGSYTLNIQVINQAKADLQIDETKESQFVNILLKSFATVNRYGKSGMVDINEIRNKVGLEYLKNNMILTKQQFDELLRKSQKITDQYIITFGQPMGSEEQLFDYRGKYYRTINIKPLKKEFKYDELHGEYIRA